MMPGKIMFKMTITMLSTNPVSGKLVIFAHTSESKELASIAPFYFIFSNNLPIILPVQLDLEEPAEEKVGTRPLFYLDTTY